VTENLLRELRPHLQENRPVRLVDYEEPSLIWALRGSIRDFPTKLAPSEIEGWLRDHPDGLCILSAERAHTVQHTRTVASAAGWNFAKGKHLRLNAITHAPSPAESPDGKQQ
jgi:hypothetical protein